MAKHKITVVKRNAKRVIALLFTVILTSVDLSTNQRSAVAVSTDEVCHWRGYDSR